MQPIIILIGIAVAAVGALLGDKPAPKSAEKAIDKKPLTPQLDSDTVATATANTMPNSPPLLTDTVEDVTK